MRARIAPGDGNPRHGTDNGYRNLGCRCDRCRAANAASHLAWTHRTGMHRPREEYLDNLYDNPPPHGTVTSYARPWFCRCDECRAASAAARARRRRTPNVAKHGRVGYGNGCRCDVCREAYRVYSNEYRAVRRKETA